LDSRLGFELYDDEFGFDVPLEELILAPDELSELPELEPALLFELVAFERDIVSIFAGEFGFESDAVARSLAEFEPYPELPEFVPWPLLPELLEAPRNCAFDTWSEDGGLCVGVGVGRPPALLALEELVPPW